MNNFKISFAFADCILGKEHNLNLKAKVMYGLGVCPTIVFSCKVTIWIGKLDEHPEMLSTRFIPMLT